MSLVKSILCLGLFTMLWAVPSFRDTCAGYFNTCERFLAKNKKATLFISLGLYIIITLFLQLYHPVDGDEGQAWLIARDSGSLKKMFALMGYEGSPGLWHLIQRPFARSGASFSIIYFLNHLFIIIAIITWLWYAPFPLLIRIMLPFTHIFLTEYSVNARTYALSTCLLFTALTLYKNHYHKWGLWSLLFFFLANTNIFGTILCCGFTLYLFLNWLFSKSKIKIKATLIIGAGILLAVIQVIPPPDIYTKLTGFKFRISPELITVSIVGGIAVLSIIIYLALLTQAMISIKKRILLWTLISMQLAFSFFLIFKFPGQVRHHFFLFLAIIMCLWIDNIKERYKNLTWLFLFIVLCLMITTSVFIAIKRFQFKNNHKKEITEYIKNEIKPDSTIFIACSPDNVATAILPKLTYKQFYMPDINSWGSYIVWNQKRTSGLFNPNIVQNVADLAKNHPGYKKYFYLTVNRLPADSTNYYHITLIKQVTDQYIVNTSNVWPTYYLYKIP